MKYVALAVAASLSTCAAPVLSQEMECLPAEESINNMAAHGFTITFGDTSGEWALFMAEDGKGRWVMFAMQGDTLCPIAGGEFGIHSPLPPNA